MNKRVSEYYNEKQHKYWIDIKDNEVYIHPLKPYKCGKGNYSVYRKTGECFVVGSYEWLFNPKYKVFEVFDAYVSSHSIREKSLREIIDYLAKKMN